MDFIPRDSFDDKPLYKVSSCTVQSCFEQRKEISLNIALRSYFDVLYIYWLMGQNSRVKS